MVKTELSWSEENPHGQTQLLRSHRIHGRGRNRIAMVTKNFHGQNRMAIVKQNHYGHTE